MKKAFLIGGILVAGIWYVSVPFVGAGKIKYFPAVTPAPKKVSQNMKLTSNAFANEEKIPTTYTCDGQKVSPPFSISGVPDATKSLAMIVDDPDAPAGTFTHWVIWNIDPSTRELASGAVPPKAQEGVNSANRVGYTAPCPPTGSHRYFFTLFALDTTIGLDGKANKAGLEEAMKGHIIEQTNLIGTYGK